MMRRTEMNRGTSQLKRSPMTRSREKKGPGLAQRIAESLGKAIKHARGESTLLRSEAHRRNVAALGCLITGQSAQACHVNFDKGLGLKVCDSLCFPLSPALHQKHDQGGMPRAERQRLEWEYVDATRAMLIAKNQWSAEIEAHYQRAIQPLARVVHGDTETGFAKTTDKEKPALQCGPDSVHSTTNLM